MISAISISYSGVPKAGGKGGICTLGATLVGGVKIDLI